MVPATYEVRLVQSIPYKDLGRRDVHTVCVNRHDLHGWWPVRSFLERADADKFCRQRNAHERRVAGQVVEALGAV